MAAYISSLTLLQIKTNVEVMRIMYDKRPDYIGQHRNVCISDSLGVPPSFAESALLSDRYSNVTCDALFAGDHAAIIAAENFKRKSRTDQEVYNLASNCNSMRRLGKYLIIPVRPTDVDFPIAFTILLHFNAEQFERLLRSIYRPQNVYCVYVDTKSSESFQSAVKAIVNCFDNVFLASRLHPVVYTGFSRLQVCRNLQFFVT